MKSADQHVKVKTDYKMSRHFNGIVFSVISLMILIVLVLLFLFFKARNKVVPSAPRRTPSAALSAPQRPSSVRHSMFANKPAIGRRLALNGEQS